MFNDKLSGNNILFLGIGGGFDIFAGLPLFFDLEPEAQQPNVVFANYSFTRFQELPVDTYEKISDYTFKCNSQPSTEKYYFAEGWMHDRLRKKWFYDNPVYAIKKTGVLPMIEAVNYIVKEHNIDMIVLLDGGIDSIMTGKESHPGTILEDFTSLIALNSPEFKDIPKYIVCCGYGTETEEQMDMIQGLKNFHDKIIDVEYIGDGFANFDFYRDIYEYSAFNCGKYSHIHNKILKAAAGVVGEIERDNAKTVYTPFMQLWWLFDYDKVMEKNAYIDYLKNTKTFDEVVSIHLNNKAKIREQKVSK